MFMKKTVLAAALFTLAGVAQAAPITSLEITGGTFALGAGAPDTMTPGAIASMSVDGVTFDGSPSADAATSIVTFPFQFFGNVGVHTAADDTVNFGKTPVTGDLTGTALTLDLNSWSAFWNGTSFNQGATGVTATVDGSGNFSASWDADVIGGPFDGQTGHWNITGVAAAAVGTTNPVPVPAAVWLFGSGLVGLVGVARRRKAA